MARRRDEPPELPQPDGKLIHSFEPFLTKRMTAAQLANKKLTVAVKKTVNAYKALGKVLDELSQAVEACKADETHKPMDAALSATSQAAKGMSETIERTTGERMEQTILRPLERYNLSMYKPMRILMADTKRAVELEADAIRKRQDNRGASGKAAAKLEAAEANARCRATNAEETLRKFTLLMEGQRVEDQRHLLDELVRLLAHMNATALQQLTVPAQALAQVDPSAAVASMHEQIDRLAPPRDPLLTPTQRAAAIAAIKAQAEAGEDDDPAAQPRMDAREAPSPPSQPSAAAAAPAPAAAAAGGPPALQPLPA